MKCQNCGKNEVNFHYSSSVNGCVTEAYLCSDCASKSGYDFESMFDVFDTGSFFDGVFPVFGRMSGLRPAPMMRYEAFPFFVRPRIGVLARQSGCETAQPDSRAEAAAESGTEAQTAAQTAEEQVDGEMKKRRELNMLREQMRIAAEKDDFEKAIELREQIKGMEA